MSVFCRILTNTSHTHGLTEPNAVYMTSNFCDGLLIFK